MEPRGFAYEILGRCGNDYEAPHTIASDLARDLGRTVTEEEVRAALIDLAVAGQVDAYIFLPCQSEYVRISPTEATSIDQPWFMMSQKGRAEYGAS